MADRSSKKAFWERRTRHIEAEAKGQARAFVKNPASALKRKGPILEAIHWRRIVLDEGHEALATYGKASRTIL